MHAVPSGTVGGKPWATRLTLYAGLALLLLGLAVRFRQYLACTSYWYDESFMVLNVFHRDCAHLLGAIDYQVLGPPGFLWLLRATYLLLGPAEWSMRLPAFLAGLAALFLAPSLARRVAGSPGWVWGVGLCALSMHAVMHTCEVRPYAYDLLCTELALFGGFTWMTPDAGRRAHLLGLAALFGVGLFGPWLSFPSAFVLGGASLALFGDACRRPTRGRWACWAALNGLLLLSGFVVWFISARYLYYPGLQNHWSRGFPDLSTAARTLRWTFRTLVGVGQYGNDGLGAPLLALAVGGACVLARRSWPTAILVAGPVLVGLAAAFARRYPMDDRTLLFAVPCVWLLAAVGIGAVVQALRGRVAVAAAAALALLLAPGLVEMGKEMAWAVPRVEFRGAFATVRQHWSEGDAVWSGYSEVWMTYFGAGPPLVHHDTPPEEVERIARRGRLWLIYSPGYMNARTTADDLRARLGAAGCVETEHYSVRGLQISLYEPPPAERKE